METGHLPLLVPHQHEEGVHEVCELGEEVPPDRAGHNVPILRVRVVHRLADPAVLPGQPEPGQPAEDPEAHEGLEEVVEEHQLLHIIGRPALHEGGASKAHQVVVKQAKGEGGPWGGHQEPVINPTQKKWY